MEAINASPDPAGIGRAEPPRSPGATGSPAPVKLIPTGSRPAARASAARLAGTETGKDVGDLGDGPRPGSRRPPPQGPGGHAKRQAIQYPRTPPDRAGPDLPTSRAGQDQNPWLKTTSPAGQLSAPGGIGSLGRGFDDNNHNPKTHLAETRNRSKQRGANEPTLRIAGRTRDFRSGDHSPAARELGTPGRRVRYLLENCRLRHKVSRSL